MLDNNTIFDWRAHLPVHPAADIFPLLAEAELRELAADIEAHGLRAPPVAWSPVGHEHGPVLLDGRNRLDALALLGLLYATDGLLYLRTWTGTKWAELSGCLLHYEDVHGVDPYALVLSYNIHRRHLTGEQKRELIAKLLKAKPEASNVAVAKQVRAGDKTVASVRRELEANSEIPNKPARVEASGRKARGRKPGSKPAKPYTPRPKLNPQRLENAKAKLVEIVLGDAAEASAAERKAQYAGSGLGAEQPCAELEIIPPDRENVCPHCNGTGKIVSSGSHTAEADEPKLVR